MERQPQPGSAIPSDASLDARALRARHEGSAATVDRADTLSAMTRDELLDRLSFIARTPARILDAGGGTGIGALALAKRYPQCEVVLLDHAITRCRRARRRRGWRRRFAVVAGDMQSMPFRDQAFDMVFANLSLQDCLPPDAALRECRRVLAADGLLMFATLGPGTLTEVRTAWARAGADAEHVHGFVDMLDLGEALGRCGFREPVLDVDHHAFHFPTLDGLVRTLREAGAICAAAGRSRTLAGRRRGAVFSEAMTDAGGAVEVSAEVVYGHAWAAPLPSQPATNGEGVNAQGEVTVPLSQLRRR